MVGPRTRHELFAGIFLIVAVCIISLSIWILGAERQIFSRQEPYKVTFQDIKGLNAGAPVRLGGITIGRVANIGFSPDLADSRVHVTLMINDDFLERIREDSEVSIETQGLLGDKFVSIETGMKNKQLLPGATLKSRESGDFAAVLSKAERVVQNTVDISDTFKKLAEDIHNESLKTITDAFSSLGAASKNIKELTDGVKNGKGPLHDIIYGENGGGTTQSLQKAADQIALASGKLADTLDSIKSGNGILHNLIYADSPKNMDETLAKLHNAAANLEKASQALSQGTGTIGALLIDSKVYDNLVEVTDEAKRSLILRGAIRSALDGAGTDGANAGQAQQ